MNKYSCLLTFLVCNLLSGIAFGQSGKVTGMVTSDGRAPIPGATVIALKTGQGTATDSTGHFELLAGAGDSLSVSAIGFVDKNIVVGASRTLNVVLVASTGELENIVVVGYGSQKKGNLSDAVATVDVEKTFTNRPISDPMRALQGVVPGLNIMYKNGGLTTTADFNIRGIGSINSSGLGRPLILVDNIETQDLSIINPNDIASISVLKDATSAAIYGTRAAFGVVLIKMKEGKRNQKPFVSFNSNFSWSKAISLPQFADPVKELPGIISAAQRAGTASPESFGMQLKTLLSGIQTWEEKYKNTNTGMEMIKGQDFDIINNIFYFYKVWDVNKIMFRTMPQSNQTLSITGGGDRVSYYLSAGYNNQGGMFKMNPDNIKKYNLVGGVNVDITKWWTVGIKSMYRNFEYTAPYGYQDYFYYMYRWGAYWPYGTYNGQYFRNVPGFLNAAHPSSTIDNYTRVELTTTMKLLKGLELNVNYVVGKDNVIGHQVGGPVKVLNNWAALPDPNNISSALTDVSLASQNVASYNASRVGQNSFNAFLTYTKNLGDHHFKLMGGANTEDFENLSISASRRNLLDPDKGELNLATGDQFANSSHGNRAYAGFFGRLNYDYKEKYILEVMGRYDGTSSFPSVTRWGFFSGLSGAYRISSEAFMQSLKPVLNDWKIRASWGAVGNQDFGGNQFFIPSMYNTSGYWMAGGNWAQGVSLPRAVPKDLLWEKVQSIDIGTDFSFFKNNNLSVTFDWYQRTTSDMITTVVLPGAFGTSGGPTGLPDLNPKRNDGTLRTRGYEISINGYVPVNSDLSLYGMLGFSDNKTIVTKWYNPSQLINNYYSGSTFGDIWGFETDRYFTDADFVKDGSGKITGYADGIASQKNLQTGNFVFGPGDIKYRNLNGDTQIDGGKGSASDHGDLKVIGNTRPRYIYNGRIGGNYKNFDLDVFFQGVGKQNVWGLGNVVLPMYQGTDILYADQVDYWTPENPDARFPNPYPNNQGGTVSGLQAGSNNFYPQTKYLLNLAYARLKNLTIGYTLPYDLLAKYHFQKVRVYLSGENLATIKDKYLPIDPEAYDVSSTAGFTGRTWPIARTFSFGVQINFQ